VRLPRWLGAAALIALVAAYYLLPANGRLRKRPVRVGAGRLQYPPLTYFKASIEKIIL
jgi:hypothetical protein